MGEMYKGLGHLVLTHCEFKVVVSAVLKTLSFLLCVNWTCLLVFAAFSVQIRKFDFCLSCWFRYCAMEVLHNLARKFEGGGKEEPAKKVVTVQPSDEQPGCVVVLFDYTAQYETELTIHKDEIIKVPPKI